jgi:Flp pilus assembly protein TadG
MITTYIRSKCPRRKSSERGNTLIETSLVLVPLLALLFAIIDFGFAIFLRSTFQHAVREGVRYAVTFQTMAGLGHDASIKKTVQDNSMGFLHSGNANLIQINYFLPNTLAATPNNDPGNLVEVSVNNYSFGWMAPLMRSATPLAISVRSSDRMETLPGGMNPPAR